MTAAIRQYRAIQALARRSKATSEPVDAPESTTRNVTGYAALWLLAIGMGFLYGTAIGHAILDAIWSY